MGGGHEAPPLAEEVGALVGDGRERETVDVKTVAHGSHPWPVEDHTSENVRGIQARLDGSKKDTKLSGWERRVEGVGGGVTMIIIYCTRFSN